MLGLGVGLKLLHYHDALNDIGCSSTFNGEMMTLVSDFSTNSLQSTYMCLTSMPLGLVFFQNVLLYY